MKRTLFLAILFILLVGLSAGAVGAQSAIGFRGTSRITKIVIDKIESPALEGRSFGTVGQYEKIIGRAFGEIDPADPLNQGIVNLDKAPRNARGMVEYDVDLYILKPVDMGKGNNTLFYTIPNRGSLNFAFNVGAANVYDWIKAADAGDGFAMNRGYTLVWSGWQADVPVAAGLKVARFPVAKNPDGSPIQKKIWVELTFTQPLTRTVFTTSLGWDGLLGAVTSNPYPAVEASMSSATLSRRTGPEASSELIPRDQWSFAKCADGKTMTASNVDLCYPVGFSTNYLYDLIYEARDPIVMGLGFAATRDLVSFLRYDTSDANPLVQRSGAPGRNPIQWSLGVGQAQSGRYLRDFLYQGFNQDTAGRRVFDGTIPMKTGARLTFTNYEFGMPGRLPMGLESHFYPGDQFPFAYETTTDPLSGKTDGLLERCRTQGVCPKIIHVDTGTEGTNGRASLVVTDPGGTKDAPIPDNVRLYYLSSTQHVLSPVTSKGICQQLSNPLSFIETLRALLVAMQAWVANGTEPPPTQYPRLSDGTLVLALPQAAMGFPNIPGLQYTGKFNDLFLNDYSVLPYRHVPGKQYPVFVPKVDRDGNEIAGIRAVRLQAPIGTYTGWNLRAAGYMENEGCGLPGSYIPFAVTAAERKAKGDPRLALEERYGRQQKYVEAITAAAQKLVADRFLLPEDAERLIKQAETEKLGFAPR